MRYGLNLLQPFNMFREFDDLCCNVLIGDEALNENRELSPKINIVENEKFYLISAELPGVEKDKIDIDINDKTLTIKGEKKFAKKEEKDSYLRVERAYGKFHRTFHLDETVDLEKIDAAYKDGVLEIILTKKEAAAPKKIEVKVN